MGPCSMLTRVAAIGFLAASCAIVVEAQTVATLPNGSRLLTATCNDATVISLGGQCYTLVVPENRSPPIGKVAPPGAKMIEVPVFVFAGTQRILRPDPVFYFEGGPSSSLLPMSSAKPQYAEHYGGRDVVVPELRGLPNARPALQCPDENVTYARVVAKDEGNHEKIRVWENFLIKCHAKLVAEGIDPSQYNDFANAQDMEDLRQLLGYGPINVTGTSAGGGLGMTYLKYFPKSARSAVLNSPWLHDLKYRPPLGEIYAWRQTYQIAADLCKMDDKCSTSFPTFAFDLDRARAMLDEVPWKFTVTDKTTGALRTISFEGMDLEWLVYHFLFDGNYHKLPLLLQQINDGNYEALNAFRDFQTMFSSPYYFRSPPSARAFGHYWSAVCGDAGATRLTREDAISMIEREPTLLTWERPLTMCAWWPSKGAVPRDHTAPVASSVPVLFLNGQFDACCSRRWTDHAARYLTTAEVVEFAGLGHGAGGSSNQCAQAMVQQFLLEPGKPVDRACLKDFKPKDWVYQ